MATRPTAFLSVLAFLLSLGLTRLEAGDAKEPPTPKAGPSSSSDKRSSWPDSFKYYGPNGLWEKWSASQRLGRDTWIFWTGGNQKLLRLATVLGGQNEAPLSIEYFRMLDSRNRGDRFKRLGLINEPNCVAARQADEYGLWLDEWKGDPLDYYPTKYYPAYEKANGVPPYTPDGAALYGEPSGVVGLRKFKNPKFDKNKWDVKKYFAAPWSLEPPYHFGFSCAFCHMSFDPTNPPSNPESPRWENLAANVGNLHLREGDLFLARGRVLFGDRNPGPNRSTDPYDTEGLNARSLLFHYAVTQQPGTSETSRISYDFINNPNTINSIFNFGNRPLFAERTPDGRLRVVNHVLKDGADSVGIDMALLRVWINIGCEGPYWIDTLYNPVTGNKQRPLNLNELRLNSRTDDELSASEKNRRAELRRKYGPEVGHDWAEAHRRNPHLLGYLASYTPYHLENAADGKSHLLNESKPADKTRLDNGKRVFAETCAECHSNKQPMYSLVRNQAQKVKFFTSSVASPDFRDNNTLSDDVRYSVTSPGMGTNMARALATNAVEGDVWAELSSRDYKTLAPLGTYRFRYTFVNGQLSSKGYKYTTEDKDLVIDFTAPGGGRGYYRTPSLVSMWATAPYLHNNALGDYFVINTRTNKKFLFPNDGRDLRDPEDGTPLTIDTSVEGRLKMFDDAVEKLLWPEKRRYYIKRTETDCSLIDLKPIFRQLLPGVIVDGLLEILQEKTRTEVEEYIKEKKLPPEVANALKEKVLTAARAQLTELRKTVTPGDLAAFKDQLVLLVKQKLLTDIAAVVGPEHATELTAKLKNLHEVIAQKAEQAIALDALKIPRGTPVNLYFNQGAGALPYALKAQLKYHDDPRKLAETLLRLCDCPDLIEDKGHIFGADLKSADKQDLIEFLKTL